MRYTVVILNKTAQKFYPTVHSVLIPTFNTKISQFGRLASFLPVFKSSFRFPIRFERRFVASTAPPLVAGTSGASAMFSHLQRTFDECCMYKCIQDRNIGLKEGKDCTDIYPTNK